MTRKGRFPLYFYLERENKGPLLHRRLFISRPNDVIEAWCYPLAKRVAYTYTEARDLYQPAYSTPQVCEMLNRGHLHMRRAIIEGKVRAPQFTYGLDENRNKHMYMWDEKSIMEARDFFASQHYGHPRKDGRITPRPIPTVRELRAMIRQEHILYVKNDKGEFVPAWRTQDMS